MRSASQEAESLPTPDRIYIRANLFPVQVWVVIYLFLAFVGLHPLSSDPPAADGDLAKQLAYLVVFVAIVSVSVSRSGATAAFRLPFVLGLTLAWCWASVFWAVDPSIAFRRVLFTTIVVYSTFSCVKLLGPESFIRLFSVFLAAVVIADFLSVFIMFRAVHQADEVDPSIIGDWRGLHDQKNLAGAIAAIAFIVLFFRGFSERRKTFFIIAAPIFYFLLRTRSKTSLGLMPISLIVGFIYLRISHRRILRGQFALILLCLLGVLLVAFQSQLAALLGGLDDSSSLTGRGAIWQMLIAYSSQHPILGSGYGSFWGVGSLSPAYTYVDSWVSDIYEGHNGFLDVLAQTGVIGLGLTIAAVILVPMFELLKVNSKDRAVMGLLTALLCFTVLRNFTETSFLDRDNPVWITMLIVIACLDSAPPRDASS